MSEPDDNGRIKKNKNIQQDLELEDHYQTLWKEISKNYELIEGAQLSNSFVILLALSILEDPSSSVDISRTISEYSLGKIYKPASTLKDSLEKRLRREEYVKGLVVNNKTLYSITPKGKKLLNGWISFLKAFD
ncbi:MAG: PadR family transcriptional regulator [Candidatus Nitrosocosmicus sp.]